MNHRIVQMLSALLCVFSISQLPAQQVFRGVLTGHQQSLPVATWAGGEVMATLDGDTLTLEGSFENLTSAVDISIAGGAHIHMAIAGRNGPVQFPLASELDLSMQSGEFMAEDNRFELSADQKKALLDRRLYVNIHTLNFPGGEIRAQLLPEADAYFTATLFGSQEVPPVRSGGSGALIMEMTGDTLYITGSFSGLEGDLATNIAGGAHLHNAGVGANGPVIIPINADPTPGLKQAVFLADSNRYVLTEEQKEMFRTRQIYANVHSTMYGSGELRGQVAGMAKAVFYARLSGLQENPAVMTRANGVIMGELSTTDTLTVHGGFINLESDFATQIAGGAHIHAAPAGRNGGVIFPLHSFPSLDMRGATFSADSNRYALDNDQIELLFNRGLYVNIHSQNFSSGEIRGQLLPESQGFFQARLSSIYTVPNAITTAEGLVLGELNGGTLRVSGTFNGLSSALAVQIAGGSHIHMGMAGQTGPVIFPLTAQTSPDTLNGSYDPLINTFNLSDIQRQALLDRRMYVNVHSRRSPSGEVRGQLIPLAANMLFVGNLSGTSHTPPVRTNAGGMVLAEVSGQNVTVHGGFGNLGSDFNVNIAGGAHIHAAMAGMNGGVIMPLNSEIDTSGRAGIFHPDSNRYMFTQGMMDTIRNRMFYVNIHTVDNPSGEIRGQLLPTATAFFTATLSGRNAVPGNFSMANGALKLELHGSLLSVSGAFGVLTEELDTAIAGGSHIHAALAGNNGGISFGLSPQFGADMLSGVYRNRENSFMLDLPAMQRLFDRGLYANLHSKAYPGGELRGQILPEPNDFPGSEATIMEPADGAIVNVEGDSSAILNINWGEASDRDPLAYIWELSSSPDFSDILSADNTAQGTEVLLNYGDIDALLMELGFMVGDTAELYHRAVASDGSIWTPGNGAMISLVRRMLTATEEFEKLGVDYRIYPTLRENGMPLHLEITGEYSGPAQCYIVDMQGRVLYSHDINLQAGKQAITLEQVPHYPGLFSCILELDGIRGPAMMILMQ